MLTDTSTPEELMAQEIKNQPNRPQPADKPQGDKAPGDKAQGDKAQGDKAQGEGNYEASRRYREGVTEFLEHANVDDIAKKAAPSSALEARELALAADKGQQRSKGDDPADVAAMYPGRDNAKS
jgi:hypothetical protein